MQSQFHQFPQASAPKLKPFHRVLAGLALFLLALSPAALAQTANVYGALGNFDIVNNTGHDAHGFEVELEGVQQNDVVSTYTYQRYGSPTYISTATGVIVRWTSAYDPATQTWMQTTVAHPAGNFAGTCYMGLPNYATSGCEHFGVHFAYYAGINPTRTTHRWLLADPANPGMLMGTAMPAPIPAPVYTVVPPAVAGNPPVLVAEFQAPEPPETPDRYGDAQWVKVFKTQLNREVALDELVTTNAIVPQDPAQVEVSWDLVQADPPAGGNGNRTRRRHQQQGNLDPLTRAVVRRYETYAYTGTYDATTHKATCADLTCTAPAANELGDFISAQMAAANVVVNAVIVTRTGNGTVNSTDNIVGCGNKCAASYNAGSAVTLVANAGGNVFTGWTGACTGTSLNCVVTVNGQTNVGASFAPQFTLSVGRSNSGTITATPNGNDRALNCGGACSAKFTSGTVVTLTATPPAGKSFVNWTGSGAGACNLSTSTTCTLTISNNASIQANFSK